MSNIAKLLLTLCTWIVLAGNAFAVAPENGWWWNPSESGSGYAIERQGNSIFMAAFLYETSGAATWYATLLALQPDGTYKGDMTRYVGGKSLLGPYKAPTSTTVAATATAAFSFAHTGTLTINFPSGSPARTIPIQRFGFSSPIFDPPQSAFQNGWWWNDLESGTGYFIEVQGNQAFMASFMYENSGQPTWYASLANLTGKYSLKGPLDIFSNGQSLNGIYKAPSVNAAGAGLIAYGFTSDLIGSMVLPNNGQVAIKRFIFDPSVASNHAPVPNAGPSQTVNVGDKVYLNGTGTDADNDPLSFMWHYLTRPAGSNATLYSWQTARPFFTPDISGEYRFELIADDGKVGNGGSVVTVSANLKAATNMAPIADAGLNQTVVVGSNVKLSGVLSSDANSDPLTYAWFFVTKPAGSVAVLNIATSLTPSFTVDIPGNYVIGLTVSDGKVNSLQASVTVTTVQTSTTPIANAGTSQSVFTGDMVYLDGYRSFDNSGSALNYTWSINKPNGSTAILLNSQTIKPSFNPDLPGTYTLTLVVNNGKYSSSPSNIVITATTISARLSDLVISEVSTCYYYDYDCWFEIYNPTNSPVNIGNYTVKSTSRNTLVGGNILVNSFLLPSINIPSGGYIIISGNHKSLAQLGNQNIKVRSGDQVPYWNSNGFVELLKNNSTVDFVVFGNSTQKPTSNNKWIGKSVPAMPFSADDYGKSIARPYLSINNNSYSASDWIQVNWATPAGRNDIPANAEDNDGDGIPDTSELPGSTFAGIDLYSMGVRTGRRDILMEVDYMESSDPGIIPRIESLQMVINSFASKGINVIFDAGNLFSPTFSLAKFNLGQGKSSVPYEKCITLIQTVCTSNTSSRRSIYDWKEENIDLSRRSIFHYLLFGSTQQNDGSRGSSGRAEIIGNDLIVTMGAWGFNTSTTANLNKLINQQASTIMHELGHNLGLEHGGDEPNNYKPNYWSVMNYMYQLPGLDPDPTSKTAYERWRLAKGDSIPSTCNLIASPCGDSAQFIMSYSNGTSILLDENKLYESDNIGRGSKPGGFADWDLNGVLTKSAVSKDLDADGIFSVLSDYDDWSNLILPFSRNLNGNAGASQFNTKNNIVLSPLHNDRQRFSDETPHLPQHLD
jgi:hypothetical protein